VTITASVSGFSGTTTVKFLVDGSLKKTLTSGPYEYGWHTKGQSVGPHLLEVQASDTNGNSEDDDVTVNIPSKGKGSGKPSKKISQEIEEDTKSNSNSGNNNGNSGKSSDKSDNASSDSVKSNKGKSDNADKDKGKSKK